MVGFLLIFLSYSLTSLTYPDITADQIWSIRRFLPIVIPGFLIGAAFLGRRLARHGRGAQIGVGVLCLAALVLTLRTDQPLAQVREGVPQLAEVENVCDNLPAHAAVVVGSGLWFGYTMTVRSYCRVPVMGLPSSGQPRRTSIRCRPTSWRRCGPTLRLRAGRWCCSRTTPRRCRPSRTAPAQGAARWIVSNRWKPALTYAVRDQWPDARTLYLLTIHPDGTVSSPAGQHTLVATG